MPGRRDALGSVLGLAVFLFGVALLLYTFKLAHGMFSVAPVDALNLKPDKAIELATVSSTLAGLVKQILLLIVMALTGSLIASKGVHMYTESRARGFETKEKVTTVTPATAVTSDERHA